MDYIIYELNEEDQERQKITESLRNNEPLADLQSLTSLNFVNGAGWIHTKGCKHMGLWFYWAMVWTQFWAPRFNLATT